jgi:GH15 family glucan-1,4-alpha-glucosidase
MPGRTEDYAMVGDLQTAALVGSDGSVDWLCFPRFDSPACFAALLGEDANGRWRMAPTSGGRCTRRRYRGHTLVLETEWETPIGAVRVIDCMPPRGVAPDLVRVVEGVRGKVSVTSELRIRFDYGHVAPWVTMEGREVCAVAGPDALWLRASAPTRRWAVRSSPGSHSPRESASLSYSPGRLFTVSVLWLSTVSRRWEDTERFWLDRAGGIGYDGRFQDAVYRSLITLKGLTYEPSGGIVAAATTSLPETLGGSRNWDYRYCWLRDSTFTLGALVGAGLHEEARAWQQWVLRAVAGDPADAQIMYGIDGTRRLPEYELPWLPGYEGASPVRIGNDAAGQVQGDVPGEVLAAAHVGRTAGIVPMERGWELQRWLARRLQEAWKKPDNGIWESRGKRQHFVYSKVMCWVAFDYLVKGVERFGLDGPVDRWRAMRDEIHSDVLEKGYDAGRGTFTQAYGSRALDACALLIPRVGFLPYDDERVVSTVETIHNELTEDGLVLRYRTDQPDDGLAGREGSFLICSFWMVYALWGIGRHREAEELFDQLLALRNDVGLLSEEYDTRTQRLVGNFPQAFTHLALVTCALRLSDREVNSAARE